MKSRILFVILTLLTLLLSSCAPAQPNTATVTAESMVEETTVPTEVAEDATAEATPEATEEPSDANDPLTITDGAGNKLTFDKAPERIICAYTRCLELLATLEIVPVGVPVWLEAFTKDPDYFPQPNDITIIPEEGDSINLEQTIALKPDFILGWQELKDALGDVAPVYMVVDGQDSYQESHDEIRMFARLFGREQLAEKNIKAALDRLAAYKAQSPRNVSIMNGFFYDGSFYYRDGASGTCNLLNEVALCEWPDPANAASWSVQVNMEALLELDPDILLLGADGKTVDELVAEQPLMAELSAVKNDRVYFTGDKPTNLDGMGTVNMTQMLDTFMPLLYPEIFPAPLTDAQVQETIGSETGQGAAGPFTIKNSAGEVLSFDTPPQRIICLYHECLELLAALGVEPIATAGWSIPRMFAANPLYFKQPNNIQFIPDKDDNPDFELIATLKPDLVIGWKELNEPLKGIAPVLDTATSNDYQSALTTLRDYGKLLGKEQEAEAAIKKFTDRMNAYKKLVPRDITVLQSASADGKQFWVSTYNSTPCSLYNEIAKCEWPNPNPTPGLWGYMTSVEGLLSLDPDVIIFETWDDKITVTQWQEKMLADPLLSELKAVKNKRILADTNRDSYGIGIIGGTRFLDTFVPLLYPELFPNGPLTDAQVQEILAEK